MQLKILVYVKLIKFIIKVQIHVIARKLIHFSMVIHVRRASGTNILISPKGHVNSVKRVNFTIGLVKIVKWVRSN